MSEYTELQKVWYKYYTGNKVLKKHLTLKLVCTSCHYVWDTQGYAFNFCPGCGKRVTEILGYEADNHATADD